MSKTRVTIDILSAGQKPYGSTKYTGNIFLEHQGVPGYSDKNAPFVPWDTANDEVVRLKYTHMIHGWKDKPDWFEPRLTYFAKVAPATWTATIEIPYDD